MHQIAYLNTYQGSEVGNVGCSVSPPFWSRLTYFDNTNYYIYGAKWMILSCFVNPDFSSSNVRFLTDIGWIAMEFGTDIHGSHRMNPNVFSKPSFPLPHQHNFNKSKTLVPNINYTMDISQS